MNRAYDVLVVGAGYIGCSAAYHLAACGLKTALLDRDTIGGGASRANFGSVQVQDAELEHSLPMTQAGFARLERLEEELGERFGFRRLHSLLLIESERQWQLMEARRLKLNAAGIASELLPCNRLTEIEPLIEPRQALGALYYPDEAQVNPFDLLAAYVRRGRERGLELHRETEVVGFDLQGGRLCGVRTTRGSFSAGVTILTAGAWTARLGRLLGYDWKICHNSGHAMVTEPVSLRLQGHISSAAFFEIEASGRQEVVALAVSQSARGHLLLGEAMTAREDYSSRVSSTACQAIAAQVARFFPVFFRPAILRSWATPVAYTPDSLPYLGPVNGMPGLILATAFRSTVVVTPLVGEVVAQLVAQGRSQVLDITPFSPGRLAGHSQD